MFSENMEAQIIELLWLLLKNENKEKMCQKTMDIRKVFLFLICGMWDLFPWPRI